MSQNQEEDKVKTEEDWCKFEHIPVMPKESIELLKVRKGGTYVDGTLGGGGHSEIIASILKEKGKIIGIDQDPEALKAAKNKLALYRNLIEFVYDNFRNFDNILNKLNIKLVNGVLLDLGVSTYQLKASQRGFSFSEDRNNIAVCLDMRMNPNQSLTAYDVINNYSEDRLREILFKLGEEPFARSITRKIVQIRERKPIVTTNDLLEVIRSATPPKYRYSRRHGHYASKVFRAVRMEVNQELSALQEVIPQAVGRLKKGGRLVIISFHSLEDRIVKRAFRDMASTKDDKKPVVKLLTKKPLIASREEIESNPKSDSAKLRAIEKI
ncbi:16S rRNA (cytosine(1402)-N(4))-methyltransferase [bacterium (Candidatus Torokbacteria) CG_4_10_14_0_2_um_filter_35_8]|nr:MAG: 16S rRNA (cytosine(1402)-N(4))-methyltransferase [bacterium (Candidatus Torokbacteria) CG_4_10_14_0_2_um_filter_35_8]